MSYYTYILYSEAHSRFYIGYSENPEKRLIERHNAGKVKATRNFRPYVLLKKKYFETELEAMHEERRIKRMKSAVYIRKLVEGEW
jgi:putative endonuclease